MASPPQRTAAWLFSAPTPTARCLACGSVTGGLTVGQPWTCSLCAAVHHTTDGGDLVRELTPPPPTSPAVP